MLRSRRRNSLRPKRPNGYVTGKPGDTAPIRRPLRSATPGDRVLIFVFVFIVGCLLTGIGYWYISSRTNHGSLPLAEMTGNAARRNFLSVAGVGGLLAVIIYGIISVLDPYGTKAADKTREAEKRKRALLMQEFQKIQAPRNSSATTQDSAKRVTAPDDRTSAASSGGHNH